MQLPTEILFTMGMAALSMCWPFLVGAAEPTPVKQLPLPGETFLVKESPAFIIWPAERRQENQPWVWYAPTLPGHPDQHEKWMHEQFLQAGIAVAGIDVGESCGNAAGRNRFQDFYDELVTRRHFAAKPVLLGRSRGGLMMLSWASEHPDLVAGMAGIYPVFDLRSYPGLETAAVAYGLTAEVLADRLNEHNPIARVATVAKARVPVFLIHGDMDAVVPLQDNSAALLHHYAEADAEDCVQLIIAKGQGHNYWEGFFRSQALVEFVAKHAHAP